ncbi:MAG: hypothetical protein PHG69_01235, partial [Candidatus Omnitrophica bacterium]|nr:hypothetical protein [Candidatus Omnitrophota bacterium]
MGFFVEYLKLYSGSPLLPHSGFKQFMEYVGVSLISAANKVLKMGRVMEIEARKVKSVYS